ncbi:uncharacterized protein LOC114020985 [Chelonia mydas]|uniref:uncharacterized protein LOC114020985 n=1 Tax=Chelonia mydas TaxID=8469 RepID=UPI0018A213E8|nr:uncharacterized protein LOC114020985 [Chelonia mydas]XP_037770529.1 uncharacterized protein LOC114020985 [Chelonia mydas]XP_043384931.1 uncharacterized protein LOC114020985 [Chelonia mydas]
MAPVHRDAQPGRFRMTIPWGLLLSGLIYSAISGNQCPEKAPSPGDCPLVSSRVCKGGSVNIPLNAPETTLDLCKQNGSTSKWDLIYSFGIGGPTYFKSYFKEQVLVSNGTVVVEKASQGAGGNYVFQDRNGKCLAQIALTVVDSSGSRSQSSAYQKVAAAAWYWCMFPLLSLLQWP